MPNRRVSESKIRYFPAMMKMAKEIGCQLKMSKSNPSVLNGLCPFHQSENLRESETLNIDTGNPKFWCSTCGANGNPISFIAKIWGVSVTDAYLLSRRAKELTADRPSYPEDHFRGKERHQDAIPQNTAMLTRATRYYTRQMMTSYPALHLLARMGIDPQEAAKHGIGYSTGEGLKEHLREHGFNEEEIEGSPLFYPETDLEVMGKRLVLPDRDYTGATLWMTSMALEKQDEGYRWGQKRPIMFGLRHSKPHAINFAAVNSRNTQLTITDDARFYLAMLVNKKTIILITRIPESEEQLLQSRRATYYALKEKETKNVALVLHHRGITSGLGKLLEESPEIRNVRYYKRDQIFKNLEPKTRDTQVFDDFTNPQPQEKGQKEEGASSHLVKSPREEKPAEPVGTNGILPSTREQETPTPPAKGQPDQPAERQEPEGSIDPEENLRNGPRKARTEDSEIQETYIFPAQ